MTIAASISLSSLFLLVLCNGHFFLSLFTSASFCRAIGVNIEGNEKKNLGSFVTFTSFLSVCISRTIHMHVWTPSKERKRLSSTIAHTSWAHLFLFSYTAEPHMPKGRGEFLSVRFFISSCSSHILLCHPLSSGSPPPDPQYTCLVDQRHLFLLSR